MILSNEQSKLIGIKQHQPHRLVLKWDGISDNAMNVGGIMRVQV